MTSDPRQASHDAESAFPKKIKERKEEGKILSPSLLHQCSTVKKSIAWVVPQIAFPGSLSVLKETTLPEF